MTAAEEEKARFEEILPELQALYREQQILNENGEFTSEVDRKISDLEIEIDRMTNVVQLSNNQIATLSSKPVVPSGNNYINVYGVTTTGSYNGKTYDVFHIYAASKKWDGFANPLAYSNSNLVLLTDNAYANNEFLQTLEAVAKFYLGSKYLKFAIADFVLLSKYPSFFDRGTTQELAVNYTAQQTFVYSYVAEKGIDWYNHTQTTEQLGLAEVFTATSTKAGIPTKATSTKNNVLKSLNYANSNNAAKMLAQGVFKQTYYVGGFSYYIGSQKKATVNTNTYRELYSIPGL